MLKERKKVKSKRVMQIILGLVVVLGFGMVAPVCAEEIFRLIDWEGWSTMNQKEKTIYIAGLTTGMEIGAALPIVGGIDFGKATNRDVVDYIDLTYKDIRNQQLAAPFIPFILWLEVRGEDVDGILRSWRGRSHTTVLLSLYKSHLSVLKAIEKKSSKGEATSYESQQNILEALDEESAKRGKVKKH